MHLEIFHTDPYDFLDCYDVPPGTALKLEHYPVSWNGTHWMGPDGEIGRKPQFLERFGHVFRLRLAKPASRIEKELEFSWWMVNAAVLWTIAAVWLATVPPRPVTEVLYLRDYACGGLIFEMPAPPPSPMSYEPLEVAQAEPRHPLRGHSLAATEGSARQVDEWGHPLALQVDAAVKEHSEAFALCFRQSGAAEVRSSGTLLIDATVGLDGVIRDVRIAEDDFGVEALSTCVADIFDDVTVPGPPDVVAIHYPVRFSIPT